MKGVDSVLQVVRLLAACCVLVGAVAFGSVQPARAGFGGCTYAAGLKCVTEGGVSEPRKCAADSEDCETCSYSPDDTCYYGSSPHIPNWYPYGDGGDDG